MLISNGWYQVRLDLEAAMDRLFALRSDSFFEFDSLLTVEEINRLGYARNFPHLTCLMCSIDGSDLSAFSSGDAILSEKFSPQGIDMALLPAACYKIYNALHGRTLDRPLMLGCIAKCFRHEDKKLDSYRALNFTMKEFVCLGNADDARRHLDTGLARIQAIFETFGIPYACEIATDPFFDASTSVAVLSRALPTKREVVFQGHAVASVNSHRTYFGNKFDIKLDDMPVHTSCVAFGIERWLEMLRETFKTPANALEAIRNISPVLASSPSGAQS